MPPEEKKPGRYTPGRGGAGHDIKTLSGKDYIEKAFDLVPDKPHIPDKLEGWDLPDEEPSIAGQPAGVKPGEALAPQMPIVQQVQRVLKMPKQRTAGVFNVGKYSEVYMAEILDPSNPEAKKIWRRMAKGRVHKTQALELPEGCKILKMKLRPKTRIGAEDPRWLDVPPADWVDGAVREASKENMRDTLGTEEEDGDAAKRLLWSDNPDDTTHFGSDVFILHKNVPDTDPRKESEYTTVHGDKQNTITVCVALVDLNVMPSAKVLETKVKEIGERGLKLPTGELRVRGKLFANPNEELNKLVEKELNAILPQTERLS